jgi:hypothetical protein
LKPKTALVLLQATGALTLLLYPGVLIASVMSLAADRGPALSAVRVLLLLSFVYPLVWAALWFLSWRALRRERTLLAFALSAPPALFSVAGALALFASGLYTTWLQTQFLRGQAVDVEELRKEHALAAELTAFDQGRGSWRSVQKAIADAPPELLSRTYKLPPLNIPGVRIERPPGAPPEPEIQRSPLALVLRASRLAPFFETSKARAHFLDAARLLIERGAQLSHEEQQDAQLVWMAGIAAKGTRLPDPAAERENPLVWKIVTRAPNDVSGASQEIHNAGHRERELLTRPTSTYGSPLHAAFVCNRQNEASSLVYAGALLSDEERKQPALVASFERLLAANDFLKPRYEAALKAARAERTRR